MSDFDHPALYPSEARPLQPASVYVTLKPAEKAFVNAYLATLGTSARAAGKSIADMLPGRHAIDTGERGARMLAMPHVQAAIRERALEITAKFEVNANSLIKEVAQIAYANMANYIRLDEFGEPMVDLSSCTFEQMGAIAELTVEDYKEGRGDDARDVRRVKIKLHDKQNAQDKLFKMLSLYAPEKREVNIRFEATSINTDMTPEELAEMYQAKLRDDR